MFPWMYGRFRFCGGKVSSVGATRRYVYSVHVTLTMWKRWTKHWHLFAKVIAKCRMGVATLKFLDGPNLRLAQSITSFSTQDH